MNMRHTKRQRKEVDGKVEEKKTDPVKETDRNVPHSTYHVRIPFIRDIYWTNFRNLIPELPIRFYFALKRQGLDRRQVSQVNVLGFKFELLHPYAAIIDDELPIWEKNYLPVSVEGKIVLDVGAGCGETSAFYIAHGARKVIAIEPDKRAYSLLLRNIKAN